MTHISTEAFWQFGLIAYPKYQNSLLQWQNHLGANVNLALFCLYLDSLEIPLPDEAIFDLHTHVFAFSNDFTKRIRQLRGEFKAKSSQLSEYPNLRQHMLKAELLLEQQEQDMLVNHYLSLNCSRQTQGLQPNFSRYHALLPIQN